MSARKGCAEPLGGRLGADTTESEHNKTRATNSTATAAAPQVPEFGRDRRKFLIAMFICGAIPSERVVERVMAEISQEATS